MQYLNFVSLLGLDDQGPASPIIKTKYLDAKICLVFPGTILVCLSSVLPQGSRNIRKSAKVVTMSLEGVPPPLRHLVTAWGCGSDLPL